MFFLSRYKIFDTQNRNKSQGRRLKNLQAVLLYFNLYTPKCKKRRFPTVDILSIKNFIFYYFYFLKKK